MPDLTTLSVGSFIIGLMMASLYLWTAAVRRFWAGIPLLETERRRVVPWGFLEIVLVSVTTMGLSALFALLFLREVDLLQGIDGLSGSQLAKSLLVLSVGNLVSAGCATCFLIFWSKAGRSDFGVVVVKISDDIKLGVMAFAMLSVPVYGLQGVLSQFVEPHHPIMELLEGDVQASSYWIAFCAAVMIAPVAEELFFRVILQGWIENVSYMVRDFRDIQSVGSEGISFLFWGRASKPWHLDSQRNGDDSPTSHCREDETRYEEQIRQEDLPSTGNEKDASAATSPRIFTERPSLLVHQRALTWPIVMSSAIFAVLHVGQGPAPIPLFFLALGLGYIYQRTHRVLPCIVVHLLINGTTLVGLGLTQR